MGVMEYYEDMKETVQQFRNVITSDDLHYALFLLVLLIVAWRLVDIIFHPLKKHKSVLAGMISGCVKAVLLIMYLVKVVSMSVILTGFAKQFLMSSSLIVVVLGFVFQEGLSNVVHGFILFVFKPFEIGDRVQINIDGVTITGYIKSIDLRSTIIQNIMNSSTVIVPNTKMDMCVIDNSYFDTSSLKSNFLDFSITYESNMEKAMAIASKVIMDQPMVREVRREQNAREPVQVFVRELGDNGIFLRATVETKKIEDNFVACSEIRKNLVKRFAQEDDIDFAYPHMQIVKEDQIRS